MRKKLMRVLILVIFLVIILLLLIKMKNDNNSDTIRYDGKTYELLEYNMDVFTYNYNNSDNKYYEEDIIHQIFHNKYDIIYFNGDLFILNKQNKNAIKYYTDDKNYNWYIIFDSDDELIKESISINKKEIDDLYNLETAKKNNTITFDEIDMFADILKISKDGLVQGIVVLAQVDNNWYYKTEVMTEDDKEYVVKISDSLNKKINDLLE